MGVILGIGVLALLVGLVVWVVVAMIAALRPGDPALVDQGGAVQLRPRTIVGDPLGVQSYYENVLPQLPGVSILRREHGRVWVDSKPTPRMLGGAYGMILRFDFAGGSAGGSPATQVTTYAAQKLSWAPAARMRLAPSADAVERKARMTAKGLGLRELK